jgi:Fur family ferric uptake transcriptional regulator
MQQLKTLRTTKQRKVILDELRSLRTHPTAIEVYERVRKKLPKISLGTVYRNLELLSESGLIQKLEMAGKQKRFDGITENHYHVRCMVCGRVDDVDVAPLGAINEAIASASDYKILWHRLEFVGICPRCRELADGENTIDHH